MSYKKEENSNKNMGVISTIKEKGIGVIATINIYINFFFDFALKMNPRPKDNIIGYSRKLALVIIVIILGLIIILPTIIIYNINYMSPHEDKTSNYIKFSNFQNKYIMVTSIIWIIMFCMIIFILKIKPI